MTLFNFTSLYYSFCACALTSIFLKNIFSTFSIGYLLTYLYSAVDRLVAGHTAKGAITAHHHDHHAGLEHFGEDDFCKSHSTL